MSENIVSALISFTGTIIAAYIGALAVSRNSQTTNPSGEAAYTNRSFLSYFGIIFGLIGGILIIVSSFLPWGTFGTIAYKLNGSITLETGISQQLSSKDILGLRADFLATFLGAAILVILLIYWVNKNRFYIWLALALGLLANSGYIFFLNPTNEFFGVLKAGAGLFLAGTYTTIIAAFILREK